MNIIGNKPKILVGYGIIPNKLIKNIIGGYIPSIIPSILWDLPNNLDDIATIGADALFSCISSRNALAFDETTGLKMVSVPADVEAVEGMRYAETVEDGGVAGAELSNDVAMDDPANFTLASNWSITGNAGVANGNVSGNLYPKNIVLTPGNYYQASFDITQAGINVQVGIAPNGVDIQTVYSAVGTYTEIFVAFGIRPYLRSLWANGETVTVDNYSIKPITPTWQNSVSAIDPTPLHLTNADGVYTQMQAWPGVSEEVSIGDYCVGRVGNHNHYFQCTTAGTSGSVEPTWADSGTVADGSAVWTYGGRYSNLGAGVVPHVLHEPASTNYLLQSGAPSTQTTGSLGIGFYTCWLDGEEGVDSVVISAGTATIIGTGSATPETPLIFEVTIAGTITATVSGTPVIFQLEPGKVRTSYIVTTTATATRAATSQSGSPELATKTQLRYWPRETSREVTLLSDGTNKLTYSSTAYEFTDGTTAMSYVTTPVMGDVIGIDTTSGAWKLFINGAEVGTAAGDEVTWGAQVYIGTDTVSGSEIIGGITDIKSEDNLDLTDLSWRDK